MSEQRERKRTGWEGTFGLKKRPLETATRLLGKAMRAMSPPLVHRMVKGERVGVFENLRPWSKRKSNQREGEGIVLTRRRQESI